MDPMLMLVLLVLAGVVGVPVLIFVRLATLDRAVRELRTEIEVLKRVGPTEAAPGEEIHREPARPPEAPKRPPAAAQVPAPAPPTPLAHPQPLPLGPLLPRALEPRQPGWSLEWESLLGANWLSKLGIAALAVAAAFFLKYAFDSGWIGPTARVAIGIVAAGALMALAQWLLPSARYRAYAQVLMSGGIVIFFLSLYAAYNYYHLIGFSVAFGGLALAAVAASALAATNNTESVALLCLLGAFATPVLLHEQGVGPSDLARLYAYLTALNLWSVLLARYRSWFSVTALALGATWLIFFGSQPGHRPNFLLLEAFAVAFLLFACWGGVSALGRREEAESNLGWAPVAVIIVACFAFAVVSAHILAACYLWGLPSLVLPGLFLAALMVGLSVALPAVPEQDRAARQTFSYLASAALFLLVGVAITSGPVVPRPQAGAGFAFALLSYLLFLAAAAMLQRREGQEGPAAALLLANALSHALAAFRVLATVRLLALDAALLWLPLAGWITLLLLWIARENSRGFRLAVLLAAQALPMIAAIAALSRTHEPAWAGLAVILAEFLLVSGTWLAAWRRLVMPGFRGDLLGAFGYAVTFSALAAAAVFLTPYRGFVVLAGVALGLAVYHALVGALVLRRADDDPAHRLSYLGLAITFVTVAIPLQLRASALTVAWAAESVALIRTGLALRARQWRWYGLLLLAVAAGKSLFVDLPGLPEPTRLLFNLTMLSAGSVIAAAAISAALLVRARAVLDSEEQWLPAALALLGNTFFLIFFSVDLWRYLSIALPVAGRTSAQQLALSIFWSLYALALMSAGIWRRSRPLRLFGLALLFLSIIKVFILDLSALQQPYRIVSFFALGLILLLVSLLYTRFEERLK